MMYANDFGIAVLAAVPIIVAVLQQHNIAMRSLWVYDILSPANVIGGVIEPHEIVVIKPIMLEEN
jgi:hypothetical protein